MPAEPSFTLGIEEEFQLIDPQTRNLCSHVHHLLEQDGGMFKPELHQSIIEVGTSICEDIHEARREVINLRTNLSSLAKKNGLTIAASGTHPFARWAEQQITEHPRYAAIVEDMQQVARANLIFGLHVHVGIADRELAIHIMNAARYFLPHIFALSTNSPFWEGRNTGFRARSFHVTSSVDVQAMTRPAPTRRSSSAGAPSSKRARICASSATDTVR